MPMIGFISILCTYVVSRLYLLDHYPPQAGYVSGNYLLFDAELPVTDENNGPCW